MNIARIYALYPERFYFKNFAVHKVFIFVTLTFDIVSTDICLSLSILSQQSFFGHSRLNIGLGGSFGALLVGWLLVVGCGERAALTIERIPILLFILRTQTYCLCFIW